MQIFGAIWPLPIQCAVQPTKTTSPNVYFRRCMASTDLVDRKTHRTKPNQKAVYTVQNNVMLKIARHALDITSDMQHCLILWDCFSLPVRCDLSFSLTIPPYTQSTRPGSALCVLFLSLCLSVSTLSLSLSPKRNYPYFRHQVVVFYFRIIKTSALKYVSYVRTN